MSTTDTDIDFTSDDTSAIPVQPAPEMHFTCPKCGQIQRDDVLFLCNTCDSKDLIHADGLYICPSCLTPGENFECLRCGSKEVSLTAKDFAVSE